jgi:sulfur-carrier protein
MGEQITVKLFAILRRDYSVPDSIDLCSSRIIADIIGDIGIEEGKVTIIFVNGRHADVNEHVHPGDVLSLFPAIGGG